MPFPGGRLAGASSAHLGQVYYPRCVGTQLRECPCGKKTALSRLAGTGVLFLVKRPSQGNRVGSGKELHGTLKGEPGERGGSDPGWGLGRRRC